MAEKHAIANAHSRMTWERVKEGTQSGREGVMKGVEGAVEWVQGATGLKVKETLGWGETQAKKGESVVSEVIHAADKKVEEVKEAANRKLE